MARLAPVFPSPVDEGALDGDYARVSHLPIPHLWLADLLVTIRSSILYVDICASFISIPSFMCSAWRLYDGLVTDGDTSNASNARAFPLPHIRPQAPVTSRSPCLASLRRLMVLVHR